MREPNQDGDLSELGPAPDDVRAMVTRKLGDRRITLSYADEVLEALTQACSRAPDPAAATLEAAQSFARSSRELAAVSFPFAGVPPTDASPAVFAEASAPVDVAPLFNSRPPPLPSAPPVFDSRSVPAAAAPESVFDARQASSAADPESTAQAIEAAFGDSESAPVRLTNPDSPPWSLAALAMQLPAASSPELSTGRTTRRQRSAAWRPDLDRLLNPPLDMPDVAPNQARTTPPPATAATNHAASGVLAVPSAPAHSALDDFEILVDDEILEIAEDDMEMMDDDNAK